MASPETANIDRLARDLRPVQRLRSSPTRVGAWLLLVVACGGAMAPLADVRAMLQRLAIASEM